MRTADLDANTVEWRKKVIASEFVNERGGWGHAPFEIPLAQRHLLQIAPKDEEEIAPQVVRSCLVQPDTADALVRAINAADEPFFPHAQKLSHDTILPEMEVDMQHDIARYGADEVDEDGGKRLFRIRPTVGEHQQEFEFHRDDPRWRSFGRTYPFPSTILVGHLRLTRPDPLALVWVDEHGIIVVRAELWHDGRAGDDPEGASGYRLLVHKDALTRVLAATGEDAVFVVTLRRQLAYRYRRDEARDDYDRGTTSAIRASTLMTDD
jgi:hypothetical protein